MTDTIKITKDAYDAFVRYKELFIHMRDNDLTEEYSEFVSNRLNRVTQYSLEKIVGNDIINGTSTSLILDKAIDAVTKEQDLRGWVNDCPAINEKGEAVTQAEYDALKKDAEQWRDYEKRMFNLAMHVAMHPEAIDTAIGEKK
jgi:hypothetical protein